MNHLDQLNDNNETLVLPGNLFPDICIRINNRAVIVENTTSSVMPKENNHIMPCKAITSFGPKTSLKEIDLNFSNDSMDVDLDMELFLEDLTINDQSNMHNEPEENPMKTPHHIIHRIPTKASSIYTNNNPEYDKRVGCCCSRKKSKSKVDATSFVSTEKRSTNFSYKSIILNDSLNKLRKKKSYTNSSEYSSLPVAKNKTTCKCVVF